MIYTIFFYHERMCCILETETLCGWYIFINPTQMTPFFAAQSHTSLQENQLSVPYGSNSPPIALTQLRGQSVGGFTKGIWKLPWAVPACSPQGSTFALNHLSNKLVVLHFWDWKGTSPCPELWRNVAASILEGCATVKHIRSWYGQLLL